MLCTRGGVMMALGACAVALALAGCSGGGRAEAGSADGGSGFRWFGLVKSEPPLNKPMSGFERAKLLSRVRQDPKQIAKLTPRERLELSRLAAAAKNRQDRDEN